MTRRLAVLPLLKKAHHATGLVDGEGECLASTVDVDSPGTITVQAKIGIPASGAGHLEALRFGDDMLLWNVAEVDAVVGEVEVVQLIAGPVVITLSVQAAVHGGDGAEDGDEEKEDILKDEHACG